MLEIHESLVWKKFKKIVLGLIITFALLLSLQIIFFVIIYSKPQTPTPADVIIAFRGRDERIKSAYDLVRHGYASALIISPGDYKDIKAYNNRYLPSLPVENLYESKARTTFENALFSRAIIEANNLQRIILVTSWDHMPRSYLLLRIMLVGSSSVIQTQSVPTGRINGENWYGHTIGWKMVHNEIIETWGSLLEMTSYMFGRNYSEGVSNNIWIGWLRNLLLFQIH